MRRTNPSGLVRRITYVATHLADHPSSSEVEESVTPILPSSKKRRPYRVPTGLPKGRQDWRIGSVVSALVHLGLLVLLLAPLTILDSVKEIGQGAGGPGPAGGGGGGSRFRAEMLRFVRVAPPPPPPQVKVEVVPPPKPTPPPQLDELKIPEPSVTSTGTGTENTVGAGPGTGGGIGTGVGTGTGSATGPGTGGGNQANFPPTPTDLFLPPLPVPASVKGSSVLVEFDIDDTGRVLSVNFNETRDRGYNRQLLEKLRGFRFRPGTTPTGTPIRMKYQMVVDLY